MKNDNRKYLSVGIDVGADFSLMAIALPSQELLGKSYRIFHNSKRSLDGAIDRIYSVTPDVASMFWRYNLSASVWTALRRIRY